MKKMKRLAIIGSGISGLTTAFELHQQYDITIFEKEGYFGGHTDTHELVIDSRKVNIDSGFIIFCPEFYPNFCRMLSQLEVESQKTDMSFSVFNPASDLVYNATSIAKLFCQRRNLFRPRFYRLLLDIVRFYSRAHGVLKKDDRQMTVAEYLEANNYSKSFADDHLLPMISALWSATPNYVLQFPIHHLVDFFQNHGLLELANRPQWYVVKNGSNTYVKALREQLKVSWHSGSEVTKVKRGKSIEVVTKNGQAHMFDAVVFATHSDQALSIIEKPSDHEKAILGAIPFQKNHVLVHTDTSVMHPNKRSWASWNTYVPNTIDTNQSEHVCTANYWMNSLQGLDLKVDVFTSLNSDHKINANQVLAERFYQHPIFTPHSVAAQKRKSQIDGQNASYFVGAYWGWGFHEDGARSAAQVSKLIREQVT